LEGGETVLGKVHATLDGLNNTGDLHLTSRRLIWVAHRLRLPLTSLLGERQVLMHLGDIDSCYARAFVLVVEAGQRRYEFRVYRWFTPLLWWRLTRRWAAAINDAKQKLGEAMVLADAPFSQQRSEA
jgi:hypothetical protein